MFTKSRITTQVGHIIDEATGNTYCGVTPSDRWVTVETTEKVCERCSEVENAYVKITMVINPNPEVEGVAIPLSESNPCYDCGSTIDGHHTPHCDFATETDVRDLPEKPDTQYWDRGDGVVVETPSLVGTRYQSKKGMYEFTVIATTNTEVTLKWTGEEVTYSYKRTVTYEALAKGYTELPDEAIAVEWPTRETVAK